MAIKTETVAINGRDFIHTYSDAGFYISRTETYGDESHELRYDEAYDPAELAAERVYTESEELIPVEEPTEADYAAAGRIMLGVE